MASVIFPKRWTEKPPVGAQINWGHPLARGLKACFLLTEQGVSIHDLAGAASGSLASALSWVASPKGLAVSSPTTASNGITLANMPATTSTFSWDILLNPRSLPAAYEVLCNNDTSGTGFYISSSLFNFYEGADHLFHNDFLSVNTWYYLVATMNTGTLVGYRNGVKTVNEFTGISGFTPTNMLNRPAANQYFDGLSVFQRLWIDRVLSPNDIQWLYAEPYAFLLPQSPRIRYFFPNVAAPAGPTTAQIMVAVNECVGSGGFVGRQWV